MCPERRFLAKANIRCGGIGPEQLASGAFALQIMEFVRTLKQMESYDPNTSHCLHGLDADLVMLALASHEPHFAVIREKVQPASVPVLR